MQDNYKILGVSNDATDEEIESAYKKLKEKYSRDRFLEGEEGNDAARKLTKLEVAYTEIKEERASFNTEEKGHTRNYNEISDLIKKGRIEDAQKVLDNDANRDAEWHYMQSVIFYKKNWVNESKKQLEIAVSLDPHNSKYSTAYAKLKEKTEFNENAFRSNPNQNNYQQNNRQMGGAGTNDCCTFCATWCCMDMLCSICCH